MTRRGRISAVAAALSFMVTLTLTGCGGGTPSSTPTTQVAATSATTASTTLPPATSAPATVPTTTPPPTTPPCSNSTVISTWPIARRAAEVVVAPVFNFDFAAMQAAGETGIGGILFLGDASAPSDLAALLREAFASAPPGLAPLVMADQEGGGVQRLGAAVPSMPWPRTMAQTMSPEQVKALTTQVGASMLRLGVNVDLAPVVDLDAGPGPSTTDPDGLRSFSAVPATAAEYGVAYLQGLLAAGVVPVAKHFPGLGGATANTDYSPAATPPLATLEGAGLIPFRSAIAAGVPAVMVSNATVPGLTTLPASLSSAVIDGLLRRTLGFNGLVLTDSLSAVAISAAGYPVPAAAVAAIAAGADMILYGSTTSTAAGIEQIVSAIVAATTRGTIPVARLNAAVLHVLTVKHTRLCPA